MVVLQTVVFAVETLQAVYLAHKFMLLKCILVIKFDYLGCGVGGVLINNRWDQWVWSMSLELFRKSWSLMLTGYKFLGNPVHRPPHLIML